MATPPSTITKLLGPTTPFKQPSACESNFAETSALSTNNRTTYTVPVLQSTAKPSCYPPAWKDAALESRFDFYPAVCPSGWVYYSMGIDQMDGDISTAWCCNAGYTLLQGDKFENLVNGPMFQRGQDCGRWVPNTGGAQYTTPANESLVFHKAWTVSWNKTDTSTLTPQLPTLTNGMKVPTWTPGEKIPDGKYDSKPRSGAKSITIGVPIIVVALVLIMAYVGIRCYRKKQRRQRGMARAAQ
ncbi:hypothetical protein DER45DRAFT_612653 [Fusarium avenaceum]|nr:hypothetical protein DER45DRAFT_612653 [Fusarium avenaceum]